MENKIKKDNVENTFLQQRQQFRKETFQSVKSAEHHLELVDVINGVEYINDSVSVDINTTWQSLERIQKTVIWIAGGSSKNNNYEQMRGMIREKVKVIICFGKEQVNIFKTYHNDVKIVINSNNLRDAIVIAEKFSEENQCVLFSPACASYEEFENYEKRGAAFKAEVSKLKWGGI
jgi:UDP-N-acetylmuramoylalanine--D-glutamate ligase